MIEITPLRRDDRQAWQPLAVGYNASYEQVLPDAIYDRTWRRLMEEQELHGLAARLLIEAVADKARARGCGRYYWLTKQDNVRARGLYDKVARFAGFIRYDYPLG